MMERIAAARGCLKGLDAILFTDRLNIRYLSGFTGTESALVVSRGRAILFVDSRYTTQALDQTDCQVIEVRERWQDIFLKMQNLEIATLGVESNVMDLDTYMKIKNLYKGIELTPLGSQLKYLRVAKDSAEIELMNEAARISEVALDDVLGRGVVGRRECDVAFDLECKMRRLGASAVSFDLIVASGPRAAMPHGVASDRLIGRDEALLIDFGCVYMGYASDQTVTMWTGEPPAEFVDYYKLVYEAQQKAIAALKPGAVSAEVDRQARGHLESAGLAKFFGHGLGHGVGLNVHEMPTLSPTSSDVLRQGMVVTVEPGIYLAEKYGIRIEDTLVVTDNSCQSITKIDKSSIRIIN